MEIYLSINDKDIDSIAAIAEANPCAVYLRDHTQATPLAAAIKENSHQCITALLDVGAASSVFVHGYSDGSLVCTLPMAEQPPSSVFKHPEPLRSVAPSIIDELDRYLSAHVKQMFAEGEAIRLAEKEDKEDKEEKEKERIKKQKVPFNHYPPSLNVGDIGIVLALHIFYHKP